LNSQIEDSDQLIDQWRLKYETIQDQQNDENHIFGTTGTLEINRV